jgi:hypothetical protein
VNPAVSIAGKRVVFPVEIESGCYLECNSADDCQLYGPQGQRLRSVLPEGKVPSLEAGANEVGFECGVSADASPRANVTVISFGDPLK